jgi:hypothetical protein
MEQQFLLEGHRAVNSLLRKLALGMDRKDLNHKIIQLTEQRMASILLLNSESKRYTLSMPQTCLIFTINRLKG